MPEVHLQHGPLDPARVIAVVQARMGSERLPGKVLMEVAGRPMLHHTLARLRLCKSLQGCVLAIPQGEADLPLREFAERERIPFHAGDELDVLRRTLEAAEMARADHVARITGDCPLIDPRVVDQAIELHVSQGADYTYNFQPRTFPRGLEIEVMTLASLRRAHVEAGTLYQREHVTPFLRENPHLFRHCCLQAEEALRRPQYRLCVDTEGDLALIREIFRALEREGPLFDTRTVVALLDCRPDLVSRNAHVRQKEVP